VPERAPLAGHDGVFSLIPQGVLADVADIGPLGTRPGIFLDLLERGVRERCVGRHAVADALSFNTENGKAAALGGIFDGIELFRSGIARINAAEIVVVPFQHLLVRINVQIGA